MRKLRPRENIYGEGNGNPIQYSCLENPVDRGAWCAAVHGVAQSWTWLKWLSMHVLEKEMATHSSIPAWRIPGPEEPDGLLSMGLHRVGHDWRDLAGAAERIYNSSMDTQITSSCRQDLSPITRTPELDWYTLCYPASLFCFMNNDVNCAEVTDI